ncbi:MAG: response regulator [Planctomycetes bacterium]|nr:response regulator [Planctomycetota bacterium]
MRHRVLFVDDDPQILTALSRALRHEPFEILCATSGADALAILRSQPVDAIVSDHDMPGMGGTELLSRARELAPTSVRMMLTGKPTLAAVIDAINRGEIQRFFLKPCDALELAASLARSLKEKDLLEQARRLLLEYRRGRARIEELEEFNPGLTQVSTDDEGRFVLEDVPADLDTLLAEMQASLEHGARVPVRRISPP